MADRTSPYAGGRRNSTTADIVLDARVNRIRETIVRRPSRDRYGKGPVKPHVIRRGIAAGHAAAQFLEVLAGAGDGAVQQTV